MGFGLVLIIFQDAYIKYLTQMMRTMQLIVHIPIFFISLPTNLIIYLRALMNFVMFDIFFNYEPQQYITFLHFNHNIIPNVSSQMQNIGYSNRNAFQGLGPLTFFIYFYFLRLICAILIKISSFIYSNQYLNKFYKFIRRELFFNSVIGLSIEAYMEFYINSTMNI